jgi:hypothetical protein
VIKPSPPPPAVPVLLSADFGEAGCPENKSLDFWLIAEKKYKLLQTFDNEKKEEESVKFSRLTIPLIRRIYPMIMYGKK